MEIRIFLLALMGIFLAIACGVKGPPLAPFPSTPQQSEGPEHRPSPRPSPELDS